MPVNDDIPESRLMLTYRTTVNGEPRDVDLPFRLLILGDLSQGASKDRREYQVEVAEQDENGAISRKAVTKKDGLDARKLRTLDGGNLDDIMRDMDIHLKMPVQNRIDVHLSPEERTPLSVDLKLDSMNAFSPRAIVRSVPQLQALLMLKNLLQEVQANLDNRKEFRELIRLLNKMEPEARASKVAELLAAISKDDSAAFGSNFQVPRRLEKSSSDKPAPSENGGAT